MKSIAMFALLLGPLFPTAFADSPPSDDALLEPFTVSQAPTLRDNVTAQRRAAAGR